MSASVKSNNPQSALVPETRSIEFVPKSERFGKPRSLFTLWFGANMQVTAVAAGAIAVYIGVPLPAAILASILGHVIGAVFMALHSAQGPLLGIPQMIQSRAQFGFYGAIVPLILVILMYVGYFATTAVQGGAAFSSLTNLPVEPSIVIVVIAITILTLIGYRLLHAAEKWLSLASGIAFLYLTILLLVNNDASSLWSFDGFAWAPFILAVAIAATWQLTYAPYVADYSRYLPADTSVRSSFWWTYAGTVLASSWMFGFGALAAAVAPDAFDGGSVDFIVGQSPILQPVLLLIIILGVVGVNALNLYGAFMSTTTTLTSLKRFRVTPTVRTTIIIGVAAVATAVAIIGRENFLGNFLNFILLLAYFLIPWTSINLADFYLVRKEKYNIRAMYEPKGEYGGVDWRAMTAYIFGIVVEVPFISSDFYTGPFAAAFGGADISWILGIPAAGGLYVFLMRTFPVRKKYPAETDAMSVEPTNSRVS
jgi:NCS1 family nucleobase:cation symporter-1